MIPKTFVTNVNDDGSVSVFKHVDTVKQGGSAADTAEFLADFANRIYWEGYTAGQDVDKLPPATPESDFAKHHRFIPATHDPGVCGKCGYLPDTYVHTFTAKHTPR